MTTKLHDQLYDAVADVSVDLDALTATARRHGLAKRRLRRSLTTVGTAAAALALAAGGWSLASHGTGDAGDTATVADSTTPSASTPAAALTPLDGRVAAALLIELAGVRDPAAIESDSLSGSGGVDLLDQSGEVVVSAEENDEVYAEFRLLNDRGRSTIGVNVQRWSELGLPRGCAATLPPDCRVEQLANGDELRTYTDETDKPGTTRLVAELVSETRDVRVVVASSAPTGAAHALTPQELAAVASDPRWGLEVPADYATKGDALTGYAWSYELETGQPVDSLLTPGPDVD